MPTPSTSPRPNAAQAKPKGAQAKSNGAPAPGGRHGSGKGDALQQKLKKANYSQGKELVKPGQPGVISAGPRGVAQSSSDTEGPGGSKLAQAKEKGSTEFAGQLAKGDKMHAATLTGVGTPDQMGTGSFTLATGSATSGTVHDAWSLTTELRAQELLDPGASREVLLARAAAQDPARGGTMMTNQLPGQKDNSAQAQPNLAQVPVDNTRVAGPERKTKRRAVVVGNSDYVDAEAPAGFSSEFEDLPGAAADASAMAGSLKERGFEVEHHQNLNATGLRKALVGRGQDLVGGDELAVVYTGHGIKAGLPGVQSMRSLATTKITDVLPHSELAGEARNAVGRGYHLEMIIDACESDALAKATRIDLEGNGAKTASKDLIDNGYSRLPTDERATALNKVLMQKGHSAASTDAFAQILEANSELTNR